MARPIFRAPSACGRGGCGVEDSCVEARSLVVGRSAGRSRSSRARCSLAAGAPRKAIDLAGAADAVVAAGGAYKGGRREWLRPAHVTVKRALYRLKFVSR